MILLQHHNQGVIRMNDQPHDSAKHLTPSPPPGSLVSGYNNKPFGYAGFRPTGTKDWLIMLTLSGEGCVRHKEFDQLCHRGDLILLPPGIPHDYFTTRGSVWEMMWAHFIPRPAWAAWLSLPRIEKGPLFLSVPDSTVRERMQSAFERLIADSRSVTLPLRGELCLSSLEEILLLASGLHVKESSRTLDPRIHEVLDHLSANLQHSVNVSELAHMVCLSPSRLAHLFKEQTGDSIIETLLKLRLTQSAKLLEFTSRRIAEIAEDVGFQSPDFFSRKFVQYYGLTPSAYRRTRLQQTE
jgi:AraC family transcriptional regulator of arabinose operon